MLPHIAGPVAFTNLPELPFAIPHVSQLILSRPQDLSRTV